MFFNSWASSSSIRLSNVRNSAVDIIREIINVPLSHDFNVPGSRSRFKTFHDPPPPLAHPDQGGSYAPPDPRQGVVGERGGTNFEKPPVGPLEDKAAQC